MRDRLAALIPTCASSGGGTPGGDALPRAGGRTPPGPDADELGYWQLSRSLTYSSLFALPLFLLYEILALLVNQGAGVAVRNAADALLRGLFRPFGADAETVFVSVLVAAAVVLIIREQRRRPVPLRGRVFVAMWLESLVLAIAFGLVVSRLTAVALSPLAAGLQLDGPSTAQMLVLSLGAGLYEELVFRVLLVTVVAWVVRRVLPVGALAAGAVAVVVSALVFSAFHYVGPLGDAWALDSFTFRFIGGVVFSTIYLLRGFGVVAWTHALYDVLLLSMLAVVA